MKQPLFTSETLEVELLDLSELEAEITREKNNEHEYAITMSPAAIVRSVLSKHAIINNSAAYWLEIGGFVRMYYGIKSNHYVKLAGHRDVGVDKLLKSRTGQSLSLREYMGDNYRSDELTQANENKLMRWLNNTPLSNER